MFAESGNPKLEGHITPNEEEYQKR